MASLTRIGATIGAALALTIVASSIASAQVVVAGSYPYPPYPYTPHDASAKFDVKPKEAAVYIDGFYAGIVDDFDGPFQQLRAAPGAHEVTVYLEGYRTYSEKVLLTADNTLKIRHRMEKLAVGEVAQRPPAPPPPPPQYQQGAPSGEGGAYPPRGPVGRHGPGPRGPGDQPLTSLPQGVPLPSPPQGGAPAEGNGRGTLSLNLQPSDAEILLDGTPWSGASQDRLAIDLSQGRHNIQIRKRGYVGYLTDVQIRPGETTTLDVQLKPQP